MSLEFNKDNFDKAISASVDEQMLNTIESLHYAERFREQTFTCILGKPEYLEVIRTDLKVFRAAQIQIVICCRNTAGLNATLSRWNPRGYSFDYIDPHEQSGDTNLQTQIYASLQEGHIPVVAFTDSAATEFPPSDFHTQAVHTASKIGSQKLFFLTEKPGLRVNERRLSHPSTGEIEDILQNEHRINIPLHGLAFFHQRQAEMNVDFVLLQAASGSLFQEVFTHRGAGTLFSGSYTSLVRPATAADARDIALLMRPYVRESIILPLDEDEIAEFIRDYYLYTINEQIVAAARLTSHGSYCELGKLATLPRYQKKGRGRQLVEELVRTAASQGKEAIFALTVEPTMAKFFQSAGFHQVPRETLPKSWCKQYDFSRSSKAFLRELKSQGRTGNF